MTHIFINQLKALEQTMLASKLDELSMYCWYDDTDMPCGYVACVLGEHAIRGDLSLFKEIDTEQRFGAIASDMSEYLSKSCKALTGNNYTAESIYNQGQYDRFFYADLSRLFTDFELSSFAHLNNEYPTPSDAAIYIRAVIDKLEKPQ